MAETNQPAQTPKPARKLWLRILACVLAVMMLLSLFVLDAVRIKLGRDAKTEAEMTSAEALAQNSAYMDASTTERMNQWLRSVLSSPQTYEDYYQIATILIAQGAYARALPNIDASIRLYDGGEQAVTDELYMKQGSLHAMLGDYDAMENSFSHVSETSGYHSQKLLLIAQAAIERNDIDKATDYLARYLACVPDDLNMRLALGQLYVAAEDFARAAEVYGGAIDIGADTDGSLRFLRGSCYMEIREYALALEDFIDARALGYADTTLCSAQCSLCSFLCAKYEDCIAFGEEALAGTSELVSKPDLCYYMGLAAMTLNDYETAIHYFAQPAELGAPRQDADYYTAICLMALGQQAAAIERYTALIEQGYSLSLCYYNRAACYIAERSYPLAREDLLKIIEINDDEELVATAQELLKQL